MKKEKKLFRLPALSSVDGNTLSINDLSDIESGFATCNQGCDDGCSNGVGASTKYNPGWLGNCTSCTE